MQIFFHQIYYKLCGFIIIVHYFSFSADNEHDEAEKIEINNKVEKNEAQVSEFVERISKWHDMLRPVLATSQKRSNFDIHELGSDIMNKFSENATDDPATQSASNKNEITFTDVMDGRDETCTARYFLSLLLLTNNKNVHLQVAHPEQNGEVICSPDDIKIQFRNGTRHWDEVNRIDEHLEEARAQPEYEPSTVANENNDNLVQAGKSKSTKSKKVTQKRKWSA